MRDFCWIKLATRGLVATIAVLGCALTAQATLSFTHTITGQPLDLSEAAPEGRDNRGGEGVPRHRKEHLRRE